MEKSYGEEQYGRSAVSGVRGSNENSPPSPAEVPGSCAYASSGRRRIHSVNSVAVANISRL